MTEYPSERARRDHRIRVAAWVILVASAMFVLLRFVRLPGWGQATIVVALVLLGVIGYWISHRRAKAAASGD